MSYRCLCPGLTARTELDGQNYAGARNAGLQGVWSFKVLFRELVMSLNEMYLGREFGEQAHEATETGEVQRLVLERLWKAILAFGGKRRGLHMSGSEALAELRASAPEYHDTSGCTAVPMEAHLLSLPDAGGNPIPLDELVDEGSQIPPSEFSALILPKTVALQRKRERGVGRSYHDPRLRLPPLSDVNVYADVLTRLEESGVIELVNEDADEKVGLFSVVKKQNKQRLIIDCR
eukprot:4272327-Amphidinium_carterae.2